MIRLTAPRPEVYDRAQLRAEVSVVAPGCLDVNEVEPGLIAAYWDDDVAPAEQVWAQVVADHEPSTQEPTPDPMTDLQDQLAAQQALIDELLAALGGGGQ